MTYVWVEETSGRKRYVDDQWLNPCRECGERISVCQANNCADEPEDLGCSSCNSITVSACHCDNDYEDVAGK
jgi:hypothetical protein